MRARGWMRAAVLCTASGVAFAGGVRAVAAESPGTDDVPLAAINWLAQSIARPAMAAHPMVPRRIDGAPTATDAVPPEVLVRPLDAATPDGIGLIGAASAGLPRDLWGTGRTDDVVQALGEVRSDSLPALRQLVLGILLVEDAPAADDAGDGRLLRARIDRLADIGALEQAEALIAAAGISSPEMFRRGFDMALLSGNEDRACALIRHQPGLDAALATRVFCLARSGKWTAAANTLAAGTALGAIPPAEGALLARFLDPVPFEDDMAPPPATPVTPLDWKLYDAIGETLPTTALPVIFAHAEIGPNAGWKAQIEAAERLTRAGVLAPNVLLGLYTEHAPSASGGVWDRVAAFQRFDAAMRAGDAARIAQLLPDVWQHMEESALEVPFADLYGKALAGLTLPRAAGELALRVGLLSNDYRAIARTYTPYGAPDQEDAFLLALARGDTGVGTLHPPGAMGRAISAAFAAPELSRTAADLLHQGRTGEALLAAINDIERGARGDPEGVTHGLSLLHEMDLDDVLRRVALQLMLLERRG